MGGDFDHRWTQAREAVEVMRALWTEDAAEYHGKYYDFPPVQCNPKPAQAGGPPVILGGNARNVFRRVARWGDGWMPTGATPEQIAAGRAAIDELAEASGRDPAGIGITVFGQPADRELIGRFAAAGAGRVIVRLPDTTTAAGAGRSGTHRRSRPVTPASAPAPEPRQTGARSEARGAILGSPPLPLFCLPPGIVLRRYHHYHCP